MAASTGGWILLGIVALFALPILFGMVRDYLGFNSNKFYGDEANKNK
ncbi:hypothetical protein MUO14_21685 [Halobacillus shinanisalinarum]|uniref:Uncharacterized protein n=1 Tax=Halobacillus shinanisalinarum TaxID=2932258 RepID=A0ABY4GXR6_9BACI|nr:hypothetical protein [Halobacillus shinanisalinarum]UOQ92981.1 hypothetical protein MUO14_21685 [Halobacillus shinanisalinarum]